MCWIAGSAGRGGLLKSLVVMIGRLQSRRASHFSGDDTPFLSGIYIKNLPSINTRGPLLWYQATSFSSGELSVDVRFLVGLVGRCSRS